MQTEKPRGWQRHHRRRSEAASSRWLLALGVGIFAWLGAHKEGRATTLALLSEAEMVQRSTLIVRAVVEKTQALWTAQKTAIVTLVSLRVEEEVTGRPCPTHLTLGHYGGQIGEIRLALEGGPHFADGEEVIVFLHPNPALPKEYLLTGWTQGKWTIHRPQASLPPKARDHASTVFRPPLHPHLRLIGPTPQADTSTLAKTEESLPSFLRRIRALAKRKP